jgi:alkanesulfonate monooxygenase SsuD/methylene tetrahydromethanopterin reductase-like flavin-dependent oxidoreductase (luciferase family)/iron-sulfur cluster repair protein YtfE (RIC family)
VTDYLQELQFGVFIPPLAEQADAVVELAELAEVSGLDLVTFQDHPYQPRFLDTWTLLSVIAAKTSTVRIAPNVANLPLRPPAVLARSVASLDILSGGRVELGLGAGAFWDPIVAMGGRRLTPGESVTALGEAIDVIRAIWTGPTVRVDGEFHRVHGAKPGPKPLHDVELWLGAYKPRMLRLTGEKADGWLPSQSYLDMGALAELSARIDDAAAAAGRSPAKVRRLININPGMEPGQLAELTLEHGFSAFILAVQTADEIRAFAEDVAPRVRELVDAGRSGAPPAERAPGSDGAGPFTVTPTPDRPRTSADAAWDESTRPTGPAPDPERRYTADQQAAGQHLIDVHDGLRAELSRLRDMVEQVAAGHRNPAAVRSFLNRMTIRQNGWTLGAFCASYCRIVAGHHTLEDRSIFPHLRTGDGDLAPVIDRLEEEHEVIADLLERVDQAMLGLVNDDPDGMTKARAVFDLFSDALLSHLAYEERELVEPLARLGFY